MALFSLAMLSACDGRRGSEPSETVSQARKNVREIEPAAASFTPKAGQTIYVPVYSAILVSDRAHLFNLAINVSVRNTDPKAAVILKSVRYFDGDGNLIREFTPKPLKVGPLASAEFYVTESDKAGGRAACFLIDWIADQEVSNAAAESVMVGTANNQGVSFRCEGQVLTDLRRP